MIEQAEIDIPEEFKKHFIEDAIVKYPDTKLRGISKDVIFVTLHTRKIINKMIKEMTSRKAVGIAAVQIGHNENIIVINDGKPLVMINPKITGIEGEFADYEEGCLSIPGLYGIVTRPTIVSVKFMDKQNKSHHMKFDGILARVIQHEINHLEGVLFIDIAKKETLNWDKKYGTY